MSTPGRLVSSETVGQPANALSWLPDGRWLAVGGGTDLLNGFLTVFPAQPGPARWSFPNGRMTQELSVSPDGRWLAAAGRASGVVEAETGTRRFSALNLLRAQTVVFSPDSSLAAWWGMVLDEGDNGGLWVLDVLTGTRPWRPVRWDGPTRIAFSPDSRRVAAANANGLGLFDAANGELRVFTISGGARDVAYSPDGKWLTVGCADGTVQLFDTATDTPARTVRVHETPVLSVAFSPDGRWVAAVAEPGVGVYGVTSGEPLLPGLADVPEANKVVFSPDLRYLALNQTVGNPSVPGLAVLDATTGTPVWQATTTDRVADLEFSPDGRRIAASGANADGTGFVRIYDTGVEVSSFPVAAAVTAVETSPAGPVLLALGDARPEVTVVAAESGTRVGHKPVPGTLAGLAFAEGGESVTYGGSDGLRLFSTVGDRGWKLDTIGTVNAVAVGGPAGEWIAAVAGRAARMLRAVDGGERWERPSAHPQTVTRVAMSPDGRWVATGCNDRRTRILDGTTGVETFGTDADGKVLGVAFGPLGTLLATANADGSVVVVDLATMAVRGRATRNFACSLVTVNHDETLLAVARDDNTVSIYDLTATGSLPELRRLSYDNPATVLAFEPAGPALCVATGTPTAVLVDPRSGAETRWLLHPTPVRHAVFSADGALLATVGDDQVARVLSLVDSQLDRRDPP